MIRGINSATEITSRLIKSNDRTHVYLKGENVRVVENALSIWNSIYKGENKDYKCTLHMKNRYSRVNSLRRIQIVS